MGDIQDRLWKTLRQAKEPLTVSELAERSSSSDIYARRYVAALRGAGYIKDAGRAVQLLKDTGPVAVRLVKEGKSVVGLYDANVDPPMPPAEFHAIRRYLGMSLREMALALGWSEKSANHIRKLESGESVIMPAIGAKVRAMRADAPGKPFRHEEVDVQTRIGITSHPRSQDL